MQIEYPKQYCVFDFETTGFDPAKDKIIEIGALKYDDNGNMLKKSWLLNWGIEIPEVITGITGITTAECTEKGIDPKQALLEFLKFTRKWENDPWPMVLIGHNCIKFDTPFLVAIMAELLAEIPQEKHTLFRTNILENMVDTAVIVKSRKLKMPRQFNETFYLYAIRVMGTIAKGVKFNLGLSCEENDIKLDVTAHRAMADVELTNALYKKICLTK